MTKHVRASLWAVVAMILLIAFIGIRIQNELPKEEETVTVKQEEKENETQPRRRKVLMIRLEDTLCNEESELVDEEVKAEEIEEEITVEIQDEPAEEVEQEWQGQVLTAYLGTIQGPSGKETYYNLPMGGVVSIMRDLGYDEEQYPYWVRDDGCKMLGEYIIVAANLDIRPRGTILETSLGWAIVCDTGGFAQNNQNQVDIAVDW